MVSADGQVTLVFNGEIYNFHELAAELRAAGRRLRTRSDTEVLLELYRLHGPSFVDKMRGMFAFAIWDAPRRRLLLGRDRLGKKPLFFHLGAGAGSSFASELRALLADDDIARKPEARALHAYLSLGFVPTKHAAIEGVRKLRPGRHRASTKTASCARRTTGSSSSRRGPARWASSSRSCAITCSRR